MPKNNIEYCVTNSFDENNITLLESLIEYMEEQEVLENSVCRDLL